MELGNKSIPNWCPILKVPFTQTSPTMVWAGVFSMSNPYRSSKDSIYGYTTFAYDGLGRKTLQCQPDNGTGSGICTVGASYLQWAYAGNQTTFTDETSRSWIQTKDALGRLTQVVEPGTLNTSYQYDALGNLKCADQWETGSPGKPCASSHARSFYYDSLSRLTSSTNPETGGISYSYVTPGGKLCAGGRVVAM